LEDRFLLNKTVEQTARGNTVGNEAEGVRKILLKGIFWRILIIEGILLVWSLFYRIISDHHAGPTDLFWYTVRITLLIAIIIAFIMVTFRRFLNKKIILPLEAISTSNRQLKEGASTDTVLDLPDDTPMEIKEIVATRKEMLTTIFSVSEERLRLINFIRDVFGRYLSKKVVDNILESPEGHKIGGHRKTVTILMADIRGFTSLSETMEPEIMVRLLNRYLECMSKVILDYDGIIDEIIGDSILAIFGVPEKRNSDPERAVACALAIQNALADLNREFINQGHPPFEVGIGINTGNVIVGNIGSDVRMKYGVVGSAVNTASRIESNTVGGQILIGETTYQRIKELLTCEAPRSIMMKGLKTPLVVYSVKAIGSPYDLELPLRATAEDGIHLNLSFSCWEVKDKKIADNTMSGKTIMFYENIISASIIPSPEPLTDIKLGFDFCVEAHCFEPIYAKVLSVEEHLESPVCQLRITSIDQKDKEILDKWIKEASY
jgi:class 3 adenylate cyclase